MALRCQLNRLIFRFIAAHTVAQAADQQFGTQLTGTDARHNIFYILKAVAAGRFKKFVHFNQLLRIKIDRGYLLEKSGDLKGAAEYFAACAVTPGADAGLRAEADFAAGRIYTALKNKDLAKKHLENCVRLQNQVGMGGQQWVSFAQFLLRGE